MSVIKQNCLHAPISAKGRKGMEAYKKIAFLHGGELLLFGSVEEFRDTPQDAIAELVSKAEAQTLVVITGF